MMTDPHIARYCELFACLTPDNLPLLGELVSDDIEFRDPFNHLSGREAFLGVMGDMFDKLENPLFEVSRIDGCSDGAYVCWQFKARAPLIGVWCQTGLSRLRINEQGLIDQHLDFWDSADFYCRVPLIGALIRWIRRKVAYQPRR